MRVIVETRIWKHRLSLDKRTAYSVVRQAKLRFRMSCRCINNKTVEPVQIRQDKTTYERIKKVMSELQDMSENRYYLITNLKTGSED